ncbi:hypothetical protein K439DRAFT_1619786 [Ramaria rubella]|nr:hypothetical protein K439DRAFT_1619786 [Ramaria rubella]
MSGSHATGYNASSSEVDAEDVPPPYPTPRVSANLNSHAVTVVFTQTGLRCGLVAAGSYEIVLWLKDIDVPLGVRLMFHHTVSQSENAIQGEYVLALEPVRNSVVEFYPSM